MSASAPPCRPWAVPGDTAMWVFIIAELLTFALFGTWTGDR
jgi:hypothetical protein